MLNIRNDIFCDADHCKNYFQPSQGAGPMKATVEASENGWVSSEGMIDYCPQHNTRSKPNGKWKPINIECPCELHQTHKAQQPQTVKDS